MLAIRLQRGGRKKLAQYRVIVQDHRLSPSSGRVVAYVGTYDPHTKQTTLNEEKVSFYLSNGAQPSNTVAKIFQKEGVKMPEWVKIDTSRKRKIKNPDKLRKNQPAEEEQQTEQEAAPVDAQEVTEQADSKEKTADDSSDKKDADAEKEEKA